MPEIRHYTVTRTQEVQVQANSHRDAMEIAHAAFNNGQSAGHGVLDGPEGIWGNTVNKVKTTEVNSVRNA